MDKPIDIERVLGLYSSGLSTRQIAVIVGSSHSGIAKHIQRSGLSRSRTKAAQLRQPPTSTKNRALHAAARKKMERFIGRKLDRKEEVHHKDRNPANNDLSNLEILDSREHRHHHRPPNLVPRWLRPERKEYMKQYMLRYHKNRVTR